MTCYFYVTMYDSTENASTVFLRELVSETKLCKLYDLKYHKGLEAIIASPFSITVETGVCYLHPSSIVVAPAVFY